MESVKVIKEKDFIVKPKSTGYESIHLIVRGKNQSINGYPLKVEIQIRTIAMDFWSVLEYQLQYKKENKKSRKVKVRLRELASSITAIDEEMLEIRNTIDKI